MNPGKLKDRCDLRLRIKSKNAGGQQTYIFKDVISMRGNFREMPSKDVLVKDIQVNVRSGTLLTRFYPNADESMYFMINKRDTYRVIGFNHDDNNTKTTWALEYLKEPENG